MQQGGSEGLRHIRLGGTLKLWHFTMQLQHRHLREFQTKFLSLQRHPSRMNNKEQLSFRKTGGFPICLTTIMVLYQAVLGGKKELSSMRSFLKGYDR